MLCLFNYTERLLRFVVVYCYYKLFMEKVMAFSDRNAMDSK